MNTAKMTETPVVVNGQTGEIYSFSNGKVPLHENQEVHWLKMCNLYVKYLEDNGKVPTQKGQPHLYHWIYRQKRLLREGTLPVVRQEPLKRILNKIGCIRKAEHDFQKKLSLKPVHGKPSANQAERHTISGRKDVVVDAPLTSPARYSTKTSDAWNRKYQEYADFIEKNRRRPSKHYAEDSVLFNWFKYNRRLFNRGLLSKDQREKFKLLIAEARHYQRINRYQYVLPELKTNGVAK